MEQHHCGGILGALSVLKDHWGPVERDFAASGYSFAQACEQLTLSEVVSFILYSQPGTAVFHSIHEGIVAGDYLTAQVIDGVHDLLWAKTKDALKNPPRNRPKRTWLPGMPKDEEPQKDSKVMTVAEYMELRRKGKHA